MPSSGWRPVCREPAALQPDRRTADHSRTTARIEGRTAVDFSLRLARAAAVMTWLSLGVAVVAATLMDRLGAAPGVHVHLLAVYAWAAFGVVVAGFLSALPSLALRSPAVLANLNAVRLV